MNIPPYGVAIKEAIASNDLEKMKTVAESAKKHINAHKEVSEALVNLEKAIKNFNS